MLEMYKRDRFNNELVTERCDELIPLEQRLQDVDVMLTPGGGRAARAGGVDPLRLRRADPAGLALLPELRAAGRRGAGRHLRALRLAAAGRGDVLRPLRQPDRRGTPAGIPAARPRRRARARGAGARTVVVAPTETEAPPAAAKLDAPCPRCGATYEAHQEYCLDCGLRLPAEATGVVAALGGAWRRRLRWYPGDWMWVVLGLLGIAALGAGLAVLASRGGPAPETIVATTSPGVTTRQAVQTTPVPTAAAQPTPPAAPPPAVQNPPPAQQSSASGRRTRAAGPSSCAPTRAPRSPAQEAREALGSGLRDVGVIESSDYSSLHPGYFVVFSGIYDDQGDAEAALTGAEDAGYPEAYVRPVSP